MSNLFSNMFQNQSKQQNPKTIAMQMIENMHRAGRLTDGQYNALIQNQNDPNGLLNTLLQNNIATNEQYSQARNSVESFFGSK